MTFSYLCMYIFFLELISLMIEGAYRIESVTHAVNFHFETYRELLVILLISRHGHIISLYKALFLFYLLILVFIPDPPLSFPFKHTLMHLYLCLNVYVPFYIAFFVFFLFVRLGFCCCGDSGFSSVFPAAPEFYILLFSCLPFKFQHNN